MRAALGRQGHAGGGRHEQEARVLIAGVVQRVEPALDERVVQGAHRGAAARRRAAPRARAPRASGRGCSRRCPARSAGPGTTSTQRWVESTSRSRNDVALLAAVEDAAAIDPGAEVGGHGHVGRGRHQSLGRAESPFARDRSGCVRSPPASTWSAQCSPPDERARPRARCRARGLPACANGTARRKASSSSAGRSRPANGSHSSPRGNLHRGLKAGHLLSAHQPRVVVLVAGQGQSVALDGVGDETGRQVVVDLVEGVEDGGHVVAGQVGHERVQRVVIEPVEERADPVHRAEVALELAAPGLPALERQRGVARVRAVVDPLVEARRRRAGRTPPRAAART